MPQWIARMVVLLLLVLTARLLCAQSYFPAHSFAAKARSDKFVASWYTAQLQALREKPLYPAVPTAETYRFLWLRTFHHPISVRLDVHTDRTGTLTTKMADGAGGYAPGKLIEDRTNVLSRDQVASFVNELARLHFWVLPSHDKTEVGTDGSEWVIEAAKGGRYHVAGRWSPAKGPVFKLGSALAFGLAKISIPQDQLY